MDDLCIVPYYPADLNEIMEIENRSFSAPWSRNSYEELYVLDSVDIWVARIGDELVGYMLLQYQADEMEVHTFAVKPERRREGIGTKLMDHAMDEARGRGVKYIYLQVRPSNEAAANLYRRFGFQVAGIRHGYYHDNKEDALVMRLDL